MKPPLIAPELIAANGRRITQRDIRRGLNINIMAGSLAMVWFAGALGITTTMFMESLGASGVMIGMVVTVQLLAMAVQIPAAIFAERLPTRKPLWAVLAALQRSIWFVPVVIALRAANNPELAAWSMLGIVTLSSLLGYTVTASWFSWMADLVPERSRGRFWGVRQSFTMLAYLIAVAATGAILDHFHAGTSQPGAFRGFALVYAGAAVAGLADIIVHLWVPEPRPVLPEQRRRIFTRLVSPFKDPDFTWLTLTFGSWSFALGVVGSFSMVYLKRQFGVTYTQISLTLMAASIATVISGFFWGRVMDSIGGRAFGGLMMLFAPLFGAVWFFMDTTSVTLSIPLLGAVILPQPIFLLLIVNLLAGAFYSGASLSQFNLTAAIAPKENRTLAMALHWTVVGLLGAMGPLVGGTIMDFFTRHPPSWSLPNGMPVGFYHILVLVHIAMVWFVALPMLMRVRKRSGDVSVRVLVGNPLRMAGLIQNIVAVAGADTQASRAKAARGLGAHGAPAGVERLVKGLDDPSPDVREESAVALGRIGTPEAVRALVERLEDPESDLAPQVARALRTSRNPATVDVLMRSLGSSDRETQVESARALGEIGDTRASASLRELLQHTPDSKVASASSQALAQLGEIAAIHDILPRMKQTRNPVLKRSLAVAIGDLLDPTHSFYTFLIREEEDAGTEVSRRLDRLRRNIRRSAPSRDAATAQQPRIHAALDEFDDAYEANAWDTCATLLRELAGTISSQSTSPAAVDETDHSDASCRQLGLWYIDLLGRHWQREEMGPLDQIDILLGLHVLSGRLLELPDPTHLPNT